MLMAADILLYDAEKVPVGKDQMQHLEMTRDVANRFNSKLGETLVVPEVLVQENTMYVPGTDGGKMSKSQNNTIDIFADLSSIKKVINKEIVTDAAPLEDPKDPESAVVFNLYKLVASEDKVQEMASSLKAGGYGWGHAKKALLETLTDEFAEERERFNYLMANRGEIDAALEDGARKARLVAGEVLQRVRSKLGY